jgi:hypothetical protein
MSFKVIFTYASISRRRRPTGLWDVEVPTFSKQSVHRWRWGQLYAALVLISVRGWVNSRDHTAARRITSISLGIEPATFRHVAYCLSQLRYRFPPPIFMYVRVLFQPTWHTSPWSVQRRSYREQGLALLMTVATQCTASWVVMQRSSTSKRLSSASDVLLTIRMDHGEVEWGDVDWIGLAQDRDRWRALVNSVLNLRVPWNAWKLSSVLITSGLSSGAQLHRVS